MKFSLSQKTVKGLVFFVLGFVLILMVNRLPEKSSIIPRLSVQAMMLSGVLLVISGVMNKDRIKSSQKQFDIAGLSKLAMLAVALLITYVVIPLLGFYATMYLSSLTSYVIFVKEPDFKHIKIGLLYSFILILVIFIVFRLFLGVPTPRGIIL